MSGMPLLILFKKISLVAVMIWPPKTERSLWIWQFEHVNFTGVILYSNRKVTKIKHRMREYMIKFCIIVIKSLWKRRWEFYKLSSLWALILRCGSFTEPALTPSQTLSLVPSHLVVPHSRHVFLTFSTSHVRFWVNIRRTKHGFCALYLRSFLEERRDFSRRTALS